MFLGKLFALPLLGLVWLYRYTISPLLGAPCRFQPTCSEYAVDALRRYGGFKGGWLMLKRIARCHPWGGSGYDPVPGSEPVSDPDTGPEAGANADESD
jgi:putative membrane protein insertion efficiency factor